MATIYFTNNADSGDGSLRSAWASAENGDVIMPSPNAGFGDEIEILLASSWSFKSMSLTLDGGTKRIILNGQSSYRVGTGSSADIVNTFRNVDFKNFSYTGTGSTAVQYPAYISGLGSLTFTNCQFYGNQCASGATSAFIRTTNLSSASLVLNNCIAYNNGATSTARFIQANTGTFEVNGCTLISSVYGNNLTNNDSILSSDSDFESAVFINANDNDYRLDFTSPVYLTGGMLTGTDFLGHARSGSKGAIDGSWLVIEANVSFGDFELTVDYAEIANGAIIEIGVNDYLTIKKGATIGSATFTEPSGGTGYLAVPNGTDVSNATFTGVIPCTYGASVTAVTASVSQRTCSFSVAKINNVPVTCIEYKADNATSWTKANVTDSVSTFEIGTDRAFKIRTFDGVNFVESTLVPRTYYYIGNSSSGSFTTASDWSMTKASTGVCSTAPTIAGCTFYIN